LKPYLDRQTGGQSMPVHTLSRKASVDLNQSAVSRYLQLATLFRRRVETGEWAVGAQIPTVDELAQECGVARLTIRQALGQLEDDGIIQRFRAKGTFVRKRRPQDLWCEVHTDWSGMLLARDGATIEVLSDESGKTPSGYDGPGTLAPRYRHLRRRHSRDGEAFLLTDVYVEETISKRISPKAFSTKTALRMIADMRGLAIGAAKQTLTIGTADIETAALIGISLNAPVAYIRRVVIDRAGIVILISSGIYRGDVVKLDMALKVPREG
jgi:GntR family transcriptional regulator